jgi:hypothetical protein
MLTNGMTAGDTSGRSYQLIGGDLANHVGHEVEITGLASNKSAGKGKTAPKATGDPKSKNNASMSDHTGMLTVKLVKMVATTCS